MPPGMVAPDHTDLRIAALAAGQHGVVSRRQLLRAGVSKSCIEHRLAVRLLHPLHVGVYALGSRSLSASGTYLAAVFACGESAVLSHRSAAALLDLRASSNARPEVLTPRRGARPQPGINVHRTRSLPPEDVCVVGGVPCTSWARTLIDLAAVLRVGELDRTLERSIVLRMFDGRTLDDALARSNGRRGIKRLRRLREELADQPPRLRSKLERRLLRLLRRARLPAPVVNAPVGVGNYEVDFHWPAQRLVVETDGRATHSTPQAFERDRRRDLDLQLAGWRVVRITWRQLTDEPERVTALLRTHLRAP
jgi:very-short-patch-repair endonuclease